MRTRVRAMPGFQVVELPTGHCPMVTEPAALVQHLLAAAAAR
jgi:pimeloyl-ACP methyl ester carboxylesterase